MARWFRFYDDALNDPKVLKLSDKLYRVWVGLLCVASKNDGQFPPMEDMALMIRMKPEKLKADFESLVKLGFIDTDGVISSPHNWNARQYKSDVSTERVKRFRERSVTVSETAPETEQIQITEKKDAAPKGALPMIAPKPEKIFFDQANEYLGDGGRSLAAKLLKAKGGNVMDAHAALLTAVQKSNPREYLGAIIRNRDSPEDLRARGEAW